MTSLKISGLFLCFLILAMWFGGRGRNPLLFLWPHVEQMFQIFSRSAFIQKAHAPLGSTSLVACSLSSSPQTSKNFCRERDMVSSFFFVVPQMIMITVGSLWCTSVTVVQLEINTPSVQKTRIVSTAMPHFVVLCFIALVFSTNWRPSPVKGLRLVLFKEILASSRWSRTEPTLSRRSACTETKWLFTEANDQKRSLLFCKVKNTTHWT